MIPAAAIFAKPNISGKPDPSELPQQRAKGNAQKIFNKTQLLMKLTLGFSTCPNDTFIFAPIVRKKIDIYDFEFDFILADVEELNKLAFEANIDITKISFHAYAYLWKNYQILDAGSALGRNNGPLIIAEQKFPPESLVEKKIAIPGQYTTANLLLQLAFGKNLKTVEYLFSDIPKVILQKQVEAGVIIHETRFTYQDMGLVKIQDLGEFWENLTKLPVPLGGIIINRKIPYQKRLLFNKVLKNSILYSLNNPYDAIDFIKEHAQEISEEVMYKHIDLYVNDFTVSLSEQGKKAIYKLFDLGYEKQLIPSLPQDIFI